MVTESRVSPQMEYCSNALSWIVDTLAQGSTFKPPRPPPTLRGVSEYPTHASLTALFFQSPLYLNYLPLLHRCFPVFLLCLNKRRWCLYFLRDVRAFNQPAGLCSSNWTVRKSSFLNDSSFIITYKCIYCASYIFIFKYQRNMCIYNKSQCSPVKCIFILFFKEYFYFLRLH